MRKHRPASNKCFPLDALLSFSFLAQKPETTFDNLIGKDIDCKTKKTKLFNFASAFFRERLLEKRKKGFFAVDVEKSINIMKQTYQLLVSKSENLLFSHEFTWAERCQGFICCE